jgi:hypothetical protein
MKITVTQEDIVQGIPMDACHCPVARAVKRATGEENVSVVMCRVNIWEPGSLRPGGASYLKRSFRNSGSLDKFIEKFDGRQPVKPASFILREIVL